jgi:hypothetical protein
MLAVAIALVLFLIALILQVLAELGASQAIALLVASAAGPFVAEAIKRWAGTSGFKAVLIAAAVSGLLAIGATFISGDAHSFGDVVRNASAVFGLATLLYRGFVALPGK